MKTQINFTFKSGDALKFSFDLTNENLSEIVAEMNTNFERKTAILNSKASKYFKKSSVLSHRRFAMDIYVDGKHVKAIYSGIDTGNGMLKDSEALTDLLQKMLSNTVELVSKPSQITEIA
jgi:hypothetical protein